MLAAMKRLVFAILLVACGGNKPPPSPGAAHTEPAPPPVDAAPPADAAVTVAAILTQLQQFTDDMCKCKDPACARRVGDSLAAWGEKMSSAGSQVQPNQEETERATQILQRYAGCMTSAMGQEAGSASP